MVWYMKWALLLAFTISAPSQASFLFSSKIQPSQSSSGYHNNNQQELYRSGPFYVAMGNHASPAHQKYHKPCHHEQQQSKPAIQQHVYASAIAKNSSQTPPAYETHVAQELLEAYELLVSDNNQTLEENIPYEQRIIALRQTLDCPQSTIHERFTLSSHVEHFLNDLDLPLASFQECKGNNYQVQLHKEVIALLDTTALVRLHNKHNVMIQDLIQSIGECAFIGTAYNQNNQIIESTRIIDFCHTLVEFSQALVEGVFEGLCKAGQDGWYSLQKTAFKSLEACHHPIQTIRKVFSKAKAISSKAIHAADYGIVLIERLANRLAYVMYDVCDLTITCVGNPQLGNEIIAAGLQDIHEDLNATTALIKNTTRYLATAIPTACTPDNVHLGSAFITQHGLKLATSHLCGKMYGRVASHALAYAATLGKKASKGATDSSRACFEVARKVSQNLAHGIADCLPAAATVKKITHHILREHELIHLLAKYTDGITAPMCIVRAIKKTRLKITEKFLKHIFGLESKLIGTVEKLSGLHHDYMGELESNGIIKLFNKTVCPHTGVITANIALPNGMVKNGKTTFFPSSWTREKVLEKIREGTRNITKESHRQGGNWLSRGTTSEGMAIIYCVDQHGKLISSYPALS